MLVALSRVKYFFEVRFLEKYKNSYFFHERNFIRRRFDFFSTFEMKTCIFNKNVIIAFCKIEIYCAGIFS